MMSRGKLFGLLIAAVVLAVGGILLRTSVFSDRSAPDWAVPPRSKFITQQRRAEKRSEDQALQAACAALQKLGGSDKNCPTK
jgi:hypothetical protein